MRGIRELLPRVELPMYESPIAPAIMVLQTRPDNRLAFDYLTAWSLLDKRPADICMDMRAYRAVGYSALPVHCQEALLLLVRRTTDDTPARWLDYDSAVLARMDQFLSDVSHYEGRTTSLLEIQRAYGDTYWYYYYFVKTPVQRQGDVGGMGAAGTTRKE